MNRREFLKAGLYGLGSSLSARLAFDQAEKYHQLAEIEKRIDHLDNQKHTLRSDSSRKRGEMYQTLSELDLLTDISTGEYRQQGGSLEKNDAQELTIIAGTATIYLAGKFFEVFHTSTHHTMQMTYDIRRRLNHML